MEDDPRIIDVMSRLNELQQSAMLHAQNAPGGIGIITGADVSREVLVEQRATAALEGSRNPAAVLAPLLLDLTAEVRYNSALLRHFGGAPPASPPPSPAREGLVLSESEEEDCSVLLATNPQIMVYRPSAEEQHMKAGQTNEYQYAKVDELVARTMDVVSTLAQIKGDKRGKMTHKQHSLSARCMARALEMKAERAQMSQNPRQPTGTACWNF
ncbi:MAG: hypothetical protein M1840_007006 [Geoglossum simile]|nr:MAG: hypothetical protein M1840_007006 [Geoglossum simile]